MADLIIDTRTACGAVGSCTVTIEPTDATGTALAVFDGDGVQVRRLTARTDATGTVTLDVTPTSEIQGTGRYYTVTITDSDGGAWDFLIEKSGASQTLYQALREDPEDLGLAVGLDNLVDGDRVTDLESSRIPYADLSAAPDGRTLRADASADNGVRAGYPSPKGNRLGVIGTSIERGTGGDEALIGTFVDGRPSNADYLLWAAGGSAGRFRYERNAGVGGNTLGGICVLLADALAGSTTMDLGFSYQGETTIDGVKLRGITLPQQTETFFFDWGFTQGSTGPETEACYVNAVPVAITGGERVTLQSACAEDHHAGDVIRWGMIGRFDYDVAYYPIDILAIGGPTNNVNLAGWDATNIAAGQQIVCEQALEADMVPIVTTICARSTYQDLTDDANKAIRANATAHGHALADFWRATVNPADRTMRTEISADGVHPNQQGAQELAQCLIDEALDPLEVRRDARHNGSSDAYSFNMLPNGTFSGGTTGSAGALAPVGWSVQEFFSSNILNTVVAPKLLDDIPGNLCRITASAGHGTHGVKASLSLPESGNYPGLASGDAFMLQAFVKLRGFKPDGYCLASIGLVLGGNLGAVTQYLIYQWGRDAEPGYVTSEALTVPAATIGTLSSATLQVQLVCPALASPDAGYGILEVGDVTLLNLTKDGL